MKEEKLIRNLTSSLQHKIYKLSYKIMYLVGGRGNMLKKIQINGRLFLDRFKIASGFVFGIASACLLFFDKKDFKIESCCSKIIALVILLLLALGYAIFKVITYKEIERVKGKLILTYGDLWEEAFSNKGKKKIVVVSVNTTFDTIVDEKVSTVDKPLVSPTTIHGQWIKCMNKRNVAASDIDEKISDSLSLQGINPIKELSEDIKNRGKVRCYSKGTIAQCEYGNTVFYLLALSEFDKKNNAQNTKEELVHTIMKLIDYYNEKGNGFDMYVPLLGTGQSRTGITRKESLEIMTSLFELYEEKLQGCVNIVVYSKDRDKVSLGV